MALTNCPECKGQVSTTASTCPHCGRGTGSAWGACPECKGPITPEQDSCKGCGFPLRPPKNAAPPPAPAAASTRGMTGRRSKKRIQTRVRIEEAPEPPSAIIFAALGLVIPILAIIGLAQSRRGSTAYILSWVAIALWIANVIFLASRWH